MDTARYKAFIAAAKGGSFMAAASEMNYTASAVSQLISALEEELQVTLFWRSRKGVSLTSDGKRLYPLIYNIVRQEQQMYEAAAEIRGLIVGDIVIAAYPSICAAWLPQILHDFQEKYPGVRIRIDDSIRQDVVDALSGGRADVAFLTNHHDFSGEWTDLQRNPIVALVGPDSEYAAMDAFPLADCEKIPIIQSSHGNDKDISAIYEKYGLTPNIVYTTRNSSTAAAMVENNVGVLMVNELSTHMWHFNVKVLPLDPPQSIMFGIAVSALSTASPAVKTFVRFTRERLSAPERL